MMTVKLWKLLEWGVIENTMCKMAGKSIDLEVYKTYSPKIHQLCVQCSLKSNKIKTRDDNMIKQLDRVEVLSYESNRMRDYYKMFNISYICSLLGHALYYL